LNGRERIPKIWDSSDPDFALKGGDAIQVPKRHTGAITDIAGSLLGTNQPVFRIRIQAGKNDPPKQKKIRNFMF
jgi:hypothetical protein